MEPTADITSSSCNFTSISGVFANVTATNGTVTAILERCDNVCSLAWGTGNPDLSGIGANISYIIQAVLIFLVGPFMLAIYRLGENGHYTISREIIEAFEDIRNSFMDVNGQFSISVAIAAAVRVKGNSASFFEMAFLQPLLVMQFLIIIIVSFSVLNVTTNLTSKRTQVLAITYPLFDGLFLYIFQIRLGRPKASWVMLEQLVHGCEEYKTVRPQFYDKEDQGDKRLVYGLGFGLPVGIFLAIIMARQSRRLKRFFTSGMETVDTFIDWLFQKSFGFALVALALVLGVVFLLVRIEGRRKAMRSIAGQLFVDDEWGFGQLIAILLWIPFLVQALYSISRCTLLLWKKKLRGPGRPSATEQPRHVRLPASIPIEAVPSSQSAVHEDVELREHNRTIALLHRRVGTV